MSISTKNDYSLGSVSSAILRTGIPACVAQIINLLYNLVDRVYIGHIPENGSLALTGLGICLPVISLVTAFTNLCGQGGAPLVSIARGRQDIKEVEKVTGNSFFMLLVCGFSIPLMGYLFLNPLLNFFGASEATLPYARSYLSVYLLGTIFVMIASGMNFHINAQGFPGIGMLSVAIGAVLNIILDPVFIFTMNMGVRGAAVATVLSQAVSALWVILFLTGKKAVCRLSFTAMHPDWKIIKRIVGLGVASFCFGVTNSIVEMVTNRVILFWGGDIYVGTMTICMSIRDLLMMFNRGLTQGSQAVLGFNYGARLYARVKAGIRFVFWLVLAFSTVLCIAVELYPAFFIGMYTSDQDLIQTAVPMMRLYMSGFWIMGLQFVGQNTFTALGKPKQAVFFSLLRKVFILVPITLTLPYIIGLNGTFLAEPISDYLGSTICFTTMMLTVYFRLGKDSEPKTKGAA